MAAPVKRCPHCEFIYDGEQNLCDMDGRAPERVPAALIGPLLFVRDADATRHSLSIDSVLEHLDNWERS